MESIKSYKDLMIWQRSIELVVLIYEVLKKFPRIEDYNLTSQIRRAAVSIPANIAEGFGRRTKKDYAQFLNISRGSLYELETHLILASRFGYITGDELHKFADEISQIGKMTNAFITKLEDGSSR
jgi:four helix bundle protein